MHEITSLEKINALNIFVSVFANLYHIFFKEIRSAFCLICQVGRHVSGLVWVVLCIISVREKDKVIQ